MRALIQRVSHAKVTVDGTVTGEIGEGLAVLLGVMEGDMEKLGRLYWMGNQDANAQLERLRAYLG